VIVRDATAADMPAVSALYHATVATTTAAERLAWFARSSGVGASGGRCSPHATTEPLDRTDEFPW
jgi:hypothetical protein